MDGVRQSEAARRFEPTEHYAAWREHCPLHHDAEHDPPFYALSRFDDIVDVLKQHDHWVNRQGPGVFYQDDGVLGTTDEPDHGRHRRVLRAAFVPTVINRLEPSIRATTTELIDAVIDEGRCDFVEAIAEPLPALAIAELLGVAGSDRHDFRRLSTTAVAALTGDDIAASHAAKHELEDYVEAGVRERMGALHALPDGEARDDLLGGPIPDDVMGRLAIARHNGTIDDREMRHLGYQLLVAGHETTTSLLGLMMLRLIERPAVMAALCADADLIPPAIEEALRFDSPVHGLFRTNAEESELHGRTLAPGTKLQLAYAAANRDPSRFADPDEFRLDRDRADLGRHLAFGWGIHFCIGAPLARLETRVVFEEVFRRMSGIELDGAPERNDSFVLHGLTRLPITFRPTTGGHA
jgi:cytochrome P450